MKSQIIIIEHELLQIEFVNSYLIRNSYYKCKKTNPYKRDIIKLNNLF